jgi:hypothetical protein
LVATTAINTIAECLSHEKPSPDRMILQVTDAPLAGPCVVEYALRYLIQNKQEE